VARVRKALDDAGLQAEVAIVEPNLEDVFVDATRDRDDAGNRDRGRAA